MSYPAHWVNRAFAPFKRLPKPLWVPVRRIAAAFGMPVLSSIRSGHFIASLAGKAMWGNGAPVPWYTIPCVQFLMSRNMSDLRVLEFGAGNSTLWWATKSTYVHAFDTNEEWANYVRSRTPQKVKVTQVSYSTDDECRSKVELALANEDPFDVVVIDGLSRPALVPVAVRWLGSGGALIWDNTERYPFFQLLRDSGLQRVDFYGYHHTAINPGCTSIYFRPGCPLFSSKVPIMVALHIRP